jgi:hypothetical protein
LLLQSPPISPPSLSLRIEGFTHPDWSHLAVVPPSPSGPADPDAQSKRQAWLDWSMQVRLYRVWMADELKRQPALEAIEWGKCAADPAYFLACYGYIFEARTNRGRGGYSPWIPFARQVEMIRWFQTAMKAEDEKADGVLSKCRDVGASWMMVALFVHHWLFTYPFNGLLVSWKEEYVDSRAPRALMWKMDQFIKYLPTFLKPAGFSPPHHRLQKYLLNPANGNTITGEATTSNTGRGDRATAVLFDEAAQIADFLHVWMGTADVTDHRFAVSTESFDKGPDFYNLVRGIDMDFSPSAFTIDYWEHPLHDDVWLDRAVKRYAANPDEFETEIRRNPLTQSHFVYPTAREKSPLDDIFYIPGSPLWCFIDPGFDDAFACGWVQYNVSLGRYEVLDGYTANKKDAAYFGPVLAGSRYNLKGEPITGDWDWDDRAEYLIEWVQQFVAPPKFVGDTYGDTKNGASADSWYSVWQRNHGIIVNRDRLPSGKLMAYRMQARTHVGRRNAARWILPSVEFANTTGAQQVLIAIQNNSFPKPGRTGKIPEQGMHRDTTTHYTAAFEYWAVNMDMQHQLTQYTNERNARTQVRAEASNTSHRFGARGNRLAEVG